MGSKTDKITRIFDSVEDIKNQGVTHCTENNGPTFIRIIRDYSIYGAIHLATTTCVQTL